MGAIRLMDRGTLHAYTIVHRSFPGVATPFVSAVVALDGGGYVRGNVVDVPCVPESLPAGLRLRVEFQEVEVPGHPGERFVRHVFVPEASPRRAGGS